MNKVYKLKPIIKSYIWGGDYFKSYRLGDFENISESWELSIRENNTVLVDQLNKPLSELIDEEDLGPNSSRFPYFPLLIKLIDAKDNLSIQVHPSDDYALKNEHSFGKSEMWHIIDADKDAGLYVGLNKDYTKEEIEKKLKDSSILECLNFYKVKPGDTFLIDPGTIHAIGKGVRLIEIQQNSDLTYRLYDYLRKDKNGNYRELHIDKALKVINFHQYENKQIEGDVLADNQYFKVIRKEIKGEYHLSANEGSFLSFTFLKGEGKVDDIPYRVFDTFFLANKSSCLIKGEGVIIISSVNK